MRDVRRRASSSTCPRPHAETQVFAVDAAAGLPFRLPDGLPPETATLLQTTTIALQAVHDASLKLGDRVAIFGLGTFGLLTVQLARLQGAAWIAASDPIPGSASPRRDARGRSRARPDDDGRRPGAATARRRRRRRRGRVLRLLRARSSRRCGACASEAPSSRPGSTPAASSRSARSSTTTGSRSSRRWEGGRLRRGSRAGRDRGRARSPRSSSHREARDGRADHPSFPAHRRGLGVRADRQPARRGHESNPSVRLRT